MFRRLSDDVYKDVSDDEIRWLSDDLSIGKSKKNLKKIWRNGMKVRWLSEDSYKELSKGLLIWREWRDEEKLLLSDFFRNSLSDFPSIKISSDLFRPSSDLYSL